MKKKRKNDSVWPGSVEIYNTPISLRLSQVQLLAELYLIFDRFIWAWISPVYTNGNLGSSISNYCVVLPLQQPRLTYGIEISEELVVDFLQIAIIE